MYLFSTSISDCWGYHNIINGDVKDSKGLGKVNWRQHSYKRTISYLRQTEVGTGYSHNRNSMLPSNVIK